MPCNSPFFQLRLKLSLELSSNLTCDRTDKTNVYIYTLTNKYVFWGVSTCIPRVHVSPAISLNFDLWQIPGVVIVAGVTWSPPPLYLEGPQALELLGMEIDGTPDVRISHYAGINRKTFHLNGRHFSRWLSTTFLEGRLEIMKGQVG